MEIQIDKKKQNPLLHADWIVVFLYLALITLGWFSICGASHEFGDTNFFEWSTRSGKQLVWILCSVGLGGFLLMIDEKYFDTLAPFFYTGMMLLLFITPFIAHDIKGSKSWISLGVVNLQPAEFAKCATALAVSRLIGQHGFNMIIPRDFAKAVGMVLLPMGLIILQRETGSALVYFSFFLMFYREGMPGAILFTAVAAVTYFVVGIRFSEEIFPGTFSTIGQSVVLFLIWIFTTGMTAIYGKGRHAFVVFVFGSITTALSYLISCYFYKFDTAWIQIGIIFASTLYLLWEALFYRIKSYVLITLFALGSTIFLYSSDYTLNNILEPHQRTRVNILLGKEKDPSGAGYNVIQSKIAIGSGGLTGKGFMNGTQTKLKYVPEQDTDFIFCTIGEEQGFIGSSLVLILFLLLILRLIYLSERQKQIFGRVYGYCVLSIILFHVFINVGMVMGLTPVIGIPLPFFSYGGSSLWGFTLLLFIFLRIDAVNKTKLK